MLARLARVLLVAALLAGWQAALLHPLQHLDEAGRFVHLGEDHSGGSDLCDKLAALTACAASAPQCFAALAPSSHSLPSPKAQQCAAEAPPFFAQGPPALL